METKTYIGIIVGLLVSSLILVAMVPVFTEVTATENQFTNEGILNAQTINETSTYTLEWDYTTPNIITVNDTAIDMSNISTIYGSVTVAFSSDWFLRYNYSSADSGIQYFVCGTDSASRIKSALVSTETSLTLSISEGVATLSFSDETSYTEEVENAGLIITSASGDYVLKGASTVAYVKKDSSVYGVGRTDRALGTSGTSFNAMIEVTIEDGVTPLYYSPQYTWGDDSSISSTAVTSYIDLYQITGFTFNLVDTDEVEHPVTYNQIFVPTEVTAEKTIHGDTAFNSVINIIPMLAGVGLLLGAVYYFISRR